MAKEKSIIVDEKWYRKTYHLADEVNPTKHYFTEGWKKGYNPCEQFDGNMYLEKYPDIAESGVCPLTHYNEYGRQEGREIFNVESSEYQLAQMKIQLNTLSKSVKSIENYLKMIMEQQINPKE